MTIIINSIISCMIIIIIIIIRRASRCVRRQRCAALSLSADAPMPMPVPQGVIRCQLVAGSPRQDIGVPTPASPAARVVEESVHMHKMVDTTITNE